MQRCETQTLLIRSLLLPQTGDEFSPRPHPLGLILSDLGPMHGSDSRRKRVGAYELARLHSISTQRFCSVKRGVCPLEQTLGTFRRLMLGSANADRDALNLRHLNLLDGCPQAVCKVNGTFQIGLWKENDELFTAPPTYRIRVTDSVF